MRAFATLAIFGLITVVNADTVPCEEAFDLLIVQDMSNSMPEEELQMIKEFDVNLTYAFNVSPEGTHVGLIVFAKTPTGLIFFNDLNNQSPEAFQEALESAELSRGTRTDLAMGMANEMFTQENGDRADKQNIMIVITDGKRGEGDIEFPLQRLKEKEVDIFAVGVIGTKGIDKEELLQIALGKEDHVLMIDDVGALDYILNATCPETDGGYTEWGSWSECTKTCGGGIQIRGRNCTNPPPQNGGKNCSELGPSVEIQGCNNETCPVPCEAAIDIGIVQDMSNSIPEEEVPTVKEFVVQLAYSFNVSSEGTHIGLIVFAKTPTVLIHLNDLNKQSPEAVKAALDPVERSRGTRTDLALEAADTEVFEPDKGDRPDKPNVMIVITDGKNGGGDLTPILQNLEDKQVEIFAIGVGDDIDYDELLEMALGNEDNVLTVDDSDDLDDYLQEILDASCPPE